MRDVQLSDGLKTINNFLIERYGVDILKNDIKNTHFSNCSVRYFFEEIDKFFCYNGTLYDFISKFYGTHPKIKNIPTDKVNHSLYTALFDFDGKPLYKKGIKPVITSDDLGYTKNREIIFTDGKEQMVIGGNRRTKKIYNKDVKKCFEDVLPFDVTYTKEHYKTVYSYEYYDSYADAKLDIPCLTRHDAGSRIVKDCYKDEIFVPSSIKFEDGWVYIYEFKELNDDPDFDCKVNISIDIRKNNLLSCSDIDIWFSDEFLRSLNKTFIKRLNDNERYICKIFYDLFSKELNTLFEPEYKFFEFRKLQDSYENIGIQHMSFKMAIDYIRMIGTDIFEKDDALSKMMVNTSEKIRDIGRMGIDYFESNLDSCSCEVKKFIDDVFQLTEHYLNSNYIEKISFDDSFKQFIGDILKDKDLLTKFTHWLIRDNYDFLISFNELYSNLLKVILKKNVLDDGVVINKCPDGFYKIVESIDNLRWSINNLESFKKFDEFVSRFDELKVSIYNFKNYMEDSCELEHVDTFDSNYILNLSKKFERFAANDLDPETGDYTSVYFNYFENLDYDYNYTYVGGKDFILFKAQCFVELVEKHIDVIKQILDFNYIKNTYADWEKKHDGYQNKISLLKWYSNFIKLYNKCGIDSITTNNHNLISILDYIRDRYDFVADDSFSSNMIYLHDVLEEENDIHNYGSQHVLTKI